MDSITEAAGATAFLSFWNPDFLDDQLGKEGTCCRFYPEIATAVDVENPESKIAQTKRKLLAENGLKYVCIPPKFPADKLKYLFQAAL